MTGACPVDASTFAFEVLQDSAPVLVSFRAERSGPCQIVDSLLEELVSRYFGRIKVVQVDVDTNQALASQWGIHGIPTVMIFFYGIKVASFSGLCLREDLTRTIEELL
ncbi:MAG: thioredoxin domain-containing protein [bacterium]